MAMTAQAHQLASLGPPSSPGARLAQEPNPFEQSFSLMEPSSARPEPPVPHPYPEPSYSREPSLPYPPQSADYGEFPWGDPNSAPYTRRGVGGRKRKPTQGMDPKKIQFLERNRQGKMIG